MKKLLKIFLPIICGLGGMALALCYIFIPQETKSAADIVIGYLNTPLGIAGGSTITLGLVVYVIVKSIGKYLINSNKINIDECNKKVAELELKTKECYEKTLTCANDSFELYNKVKDKLEQLQGIVDEICKTSPNAKIKVIAQKVEELKEQCTKEYEELSNEWVSKYGKEEETIND